MHKRRKMQLSFMPIFIPRGKHRNILTLKVKVQPLILYKGLKANPLHSMKMRFVINLRIYLWHKLCHDSDTFNLLQTLRDRACNHTVCRICAVGSAIAGGT